MIKNIKMLGLILVILVGLLGLSTIASAESDLYEIDSVKVDGVVVFETGDDDLLPVEVSLDDDFEVKVYVSGTGKDACDEDEDNCEVDVKVKVWVGGYEHDDIEVVSSTFDIEPGVAYTKTLTVELPSDMDVEDSNKYTLYVEVYDNEDEERVNGDLYLERPRHSLDVQDVLFDSTVSAGESLDVEVRVENLGEEKEDDVKVEVSLVDANGNEVADDVEYLDELAAFEEDNEDEESSDSVDLLLNLDDCLEEGSYELVVTVSYDRGHEELEEVFDVSVSNDDASCGASSDSEETSNEDGGVTVSLSSNSLDAVVGETNSFVLTFVNTGANTETFSVTVSGEEQWASSDVNPSVVMVASGELEDVTVSITPDSDAEGNHDFTVNILDASGNLVQEVSMSVNVGEAESSSVLGNTGSALKVAFIVLIVLIIIVGLIIAFRRLNDDDDDDDPLEPKDGQTYY
ncbi:MAG: hypothetical protein ISS01_01695 [Nanoarchaeota archaeon]|nr:hypothetical protein [Nanoarchaeota archaeon]